ncbi:MAG: glycoside hydrolase family protein [Methanoregula sp.]|nr:glycoside hydrolase family protein [Methanoregula sp.]
MKRGNPVISALNAGLLRRRGLLLAMTIRTIKFMSNFYKTALLLIFTSALFFSAASFALAAEETGLAKPALQVNIPTVSLGADKSLWLGEYISGIYKYAVGIVGIAAAIVLMWGGVMWLTAGGNTGQVSEAKEWIKSSLTGLLIALSSYLILYTINPDLISFSSLSIENIKINGSSSVSYNSLARSGAAIDLTDINDAASLTKAYEGLSLVPYLDSRGNWTIGYGHKLNSKLELGPQITQDEANALFLSDYAIAQNNARNLASSKDVQFNALSPARQGVLTDMRFNMGTGLGNFNKMWTAIKNNDWANAAAEIKDSQYNTQVGKRADTNAQIMESGILPTP